MFSFLLYHLLLLLVPATTLLHPDGDHHQAKLYLNQALTCLSQPSSNHTSCKCCLEDIVQILNLRIALLDNMQQVSTITIESCPQLLLSLDLSDVNTTYIIIKIRDGGKLQVENIKFDSMHSGDQKLTLELENLKMFTIQEQTITGAILISATNVSELMIYRTIFSSPISTRMDIKMADKVSLIDSVFNTSSNGDITMDNVDMVEVVNNQFSIDTVKVLKTQNSPDLYISCNRLHEEEVSMECVRISSSLQSVSSIISLSPSSLSPLSPDVKSAKPYSANTNTILWLLVGVGLSVLSVITTCVCCRGRRKRGEEEEKMIKSDVETEKCEVEKNYEKEVMLTSDSEKHDNTDVIIESGNDARDIIEKVMEQEAILKKELEGKNRHPE